MNTIEVIENAIESVVSSNRQVLLAFDYDGTLSPLAATPEEAFLPSPTRKHITNLLNKSNITAAILSGRPISHLEKLFSNKDIWLAGSGGLIVKTGDRVHEYPAISYINSILVDVAIRLTAICEKYQGAWLEIKPGTLTVHFRDLPFSHHASLIKNIAYTIAIEEKLESLIATQAIEVRPRCGWNKGTAIEIMRQELWNGSNISPYIAYFGDSANDREAVEAANRFGGISIGVGKEAPANCLFNISTPLEVERVLDLLCHRLAMEAGGTKTKTMCA